MTTTEAPDVTTLVDMERYPLDAPPAAAGVVAAAREQFGSTGAVELPGFVTAEGVAALVADAERLVPRAHRSAGIAGAYLELPDPSWPSDHPRRRLSEFSVGAVAYDLIPTDSPLRALYEWDPLLHLVGAVLGRGPVHRYADPFGALNLAVMGDGDQLQWHFDQTDFVVSLAIQAAESGGDFEVAPLIRGAGDEHYPDVARVLDGDRSAVTTLPMTPGTLLIFAGRHSLHRVSPVRGTTYRHVGLLAYDTVPGTVGSELLRQSRYGRTVPFECPPETWPV
jgi:hypothetical protein